MWNNEKEGLKQLGEFDLALGKRIFFFFLIGRVPYENEMYSRGTWVTQSVQPPTLFLK